MIEELDFAQASQEDRRGLYEVVAAWVVEDGKEPPLYEACVARWENRDELGFEAPRFVVAREAGTIIGYAQVQVSEAEANAHLAIATIVVLPEHRRRGIGTALLHAMRSLLNGQTVIESWSVVEGDPAEQFAAARWFRVVTSMTRQKLVLGELPEVGELPPGYDLVTWKGAAPDELVGAFVEGLNAMADAPSAKQRSTTHTTRSRASAGLRRRPSRTGGSFSCCTRARSPQSRSWSETPWSRPWPSSCTRSCCPHIAARAWAG